jgi:hypothetical protein
MAKEPTNGAPTAPKAKSTVKRVNKPRSFYMVYKGQLEGTPQFAFDRDALIDVMLNDRDVKVEKITLPSGKNRGKRASAADIAAESAAPHA